MLKRIKSSLAFRLPPLYSYLLKYKKLRAIDKPSSDVNIIMMTGKDHLKLLRMSVYSISKNWNALPNLVIINDGSATDVDIRSTLNFWKGKFHITNWVDSATYHVQQGRYALANYAENHVFGKKMAIILHYAEFNPIIWVDSDILFFKDLENHIPAGRPEFSCGGTEDWFRAYDEEILKILPENNLDKTSGMNAGMLYVSGKNIYEKFGLEELLNQIHPNYNFFTEQTLFAYIAGKSLGILWKQNIVKNTAEDNDQLRSKNPESLVARHYTTPIRLLFWRDAMIDL